MSDNDNGGPAFPNPALANEGFCPSYDMSGMTLRDWFAGHALAGLAASLQKVGCLTGETQAQADARWAYAQADAMLEARK